MIWIRLWIQKEMDSSEWWLLYGLFYSCIAGRESKQQLNKCGVAVIQNIQKQMKEFSISSLMFTMRQQMISLRVKLKWEKILIDGWDFFSLHLWEQFWPQWLFIIYSVCNSKGKWMLKDKLLFLQLQTKRLLELDYQ